MTGTAPLAVILAILANAVFRLELSECMALAAAAIIASGLIMTRGRPAMWFVTFIAAMAAPHLNQITHLQALLASACVMVAAVAVALINEPQSTLKGQGQ